MSNLSAFMQPNVEQVKNHKYVASHRIKGEDGKPVEWEICCISADEYARIRGACIRQVPVAGKPLTEILKDNPERLPGACGRPLHGIPGPQQRRAAEQLGGCQAGGADWQAADRR